MRSPIYYRSIETFGLFLLYINLAIFMTGSHPAHAYSANRVIDYDEWTNPDLIEERFSAAKVQYSRGFEVMENPKKRQVQAPQEALPLVAAIYTLVSNYHGLSDTDWYNDLIARLEKVVENIKARTKQLQRRLFPSHSRKADPDIVYIYSATGDHKYQPFIQSVHEVQPKKKRAAVE